MEVIEMEVSNTGKVNVTSAFSVCIADSEFVQRFYELIFDNCLPLSYELQDTDYQKRETLLNEAFNTVLQNNVEQKQSMSGLNPLLNPNYKEYWITYLIKTVSEFDPDFDSSRMREWREVLFEGTK